jgi:3-hydroxyanthranilate 3,4-dioxygenase
MTAASLIPFNFKQWIDENRQHLKPPVGNRCVWENREFIVMVVGGPNQRTDYHINQGEEFFYQVEGDIVLRVLENGKPTDVTIRQGDIFLLPPRLPHSPQRPASSVGLVIERKRLPHEKDGLLWICEKCHDPVYQESFHLTDIVNQFKEVFGRYYGNRQNRTCQKCGHTNPEN